MIARYSHAFHAGAFNSREPSLAVTANQKQGIGLWGVKSSGTVVMEYGFMEARQQTSMYARWNIKEGMVNEEPQGNVVNEVQERLNHSSGESSPLVFGGDDRRVLPWQLDKAITDNFGYNLVALEAEHRSNVVSPRFDNNNTRLFSEGHDEQLIVHDRITRKPQEHFPHQKPNNLYLTACPDERMLLYDTRQRVAEKPIMLAGCSHAAAFNPREPSVVVVANQRQGIGFLDLENSGMVMEYGSMEARQQTSMYARWNMQEGMVNEDQQGDTVNEVQERLDNSSGESSLLVSGGDDRRVPPWQLDKAITDNVRYNLVALEAEHGSNIFSLGVDSNNSDASIQQIQLLEGMDKEEAREMELFEYLKQAGGSLEDQISCFQDHVDMTREHLGMLKEVGDALVDAMKEDFPYCKAFPYGSSAIGLGMKDSDINIHVELGSNTKDDKFYEKSDIWGDRSRARKVCDILRRTERFQNAAVVSYARGPIIQLREGSIRIKCDITMIGRMGVKNTEFLALCTEQDGRFKTIAILVKYFCKVQKITSNENQDWLNSYTLMLMVVFFLQRRHILHNVVTLQEGIEEEEIGGWNFAICRDISKFPKLQPSHWEMDHLILGFFELFANFSFKKVVCPFVGYGIKKFNMSQGMVPEVFEGAPYFGTEHKLKCNKPLVVQDPFELTRNVGETMSLKRLENMVMKFETAAQMMRGLREGKVGVKFWMLLEPGMITFRNGVVDQPVMNSVEEQPVENSEEEERTRLSVVDQPAENSVDEEQTRLSVVDQTVENSVDEEQTRPCVVDQIAEKSVEEERTRLCVVDQPAGNSVEDHFANNCVVGSPAMSIANTGSSSNTRLLQFLFHQQNLRFPPPSPHSRDNRRGGVGHGNRGGHGGAGYGAGQNEEFGGGGN